MFPSYVFVESDLDHLDFSQLLYEIKTRKEGIIKELKYADDISALYESEIAYLKGLLNQENVLKLSTGFIENDKIIITDGPLIGYESQIIKIDRHKRKAILKLLLLGERREVSVPLEILKKI